MAVQYVQVEGLKQANAKLRALPEKLQRKVLRPAMQKAGAVIQAEAQIRAPRRTGLLATKIKTRIGYSRAKQRMRATVNTAAKDYTGHAFYASFLEYGWRAGSRKKYGVSHKKGAGGSRLDLRRWIKPKKFLKPAFDAKVNEALATFTDWLKAGLELIGKERA